MEWRLLEEVPAEQVRELLQIGRRRTFARNEVVFHRDDPGDSLHLIRKGRFAVRLMTPLGDVATVAVRGPGESFGEMALIAEAPAAVGDGRRVGGSRDVGGVSGGVRAAARPVSQCRPDAVWVSRL